MPSRAHLSVIRLLLGCTLALCVGTIFAYPIDAFEETGIARLEGYRLAQQGLVPGNRLPPGAQLPAAQVRLRLQDRADLEIPASDPELTRRIVRLLGADAQRYSISVLDLSDPDAPLYVEHNGDTHRNPGSVGKIMVGLALLQTLADIYPDDLAARRHVLKDSLVTADAFIRTDHHVVPFWHPEENRMRRRPLREGDTTNLWSYLDWMMSASSNAAASMVMQQVLLLRHFGVDYPAAPERTRAFLEQTPRKDLGDLWVDTMKSSAIRNGLDPEDLRQGNFFTRQGKQRAPGTNSVSTTHALIRYLLRMEQGRLVDPWSSLEIKRLMYMTQRRIRYASAPVLRNAAVYFKSGSLYRCQPEEGFVCKQYQGNVDNLMNSVAVVESPAGEPRLFYMVAITSNVLKRNSAVEHQTLATRLHALLQGLRSAAAAAE